MLDPSYKLRYLSRTSFMKAAGAATGLLCDIMGDFACTWLSFFSYQARNESKYRNSSSSHPHVLLYNKCQTSGSCLRRVTPGWQAASQHFIQLTRQRTSCMHLPWRGVMSVPQTCRHEILIYNASDKSID